MELPFTNYQNVRFSTDSKNRQILLSLTKYARIYSERKMKFSYPRGRHVKFCCSAQSSVHNRQVFVRARVGSERFRFFPIISALLRMRDQRVPFMGGTSLSHDL